VSDPGAVRERRQQRRRALLSAAIAVIRRDGADATMEEMASAGGVSKPILYRHFSDRDGLVAAITEHAMGELGAMLDDKLGDATLAGSRAGVQATIDAFFEYIERDTSLYRFVVENDLRQGAKATLAFTELNSQHVAAALRQGLVTAGRDPAPADAWGRGIVGMVHRTAIWWLADARPAPRSEIVGHLTDLVWGGVGSRLTASA
jgi:AcrR family transcriptional regulator